MDTERLMRISDVCRTTGFSRSHIYALMKLNVAPHPVKLGRARRWRHSDIQKFIASLPVARPSTGGSHAE